MNNILFKHLNTHGILQINYSQHQHFFFDIGYHKGWMGK